MVNSSALFARFSTSDSGQVVTIDVALWLKIGKTRRPGMSQPSCKPQLPAALVYSFVRALGNNQLRDCIDFGVRLEKANKVWLFRDKPVLRLQQELDLVRQ